VRVPRWPAADWLALAEATVVLAAMRLALALLPFGAVRDGAVRLARLLARDGSAAASADVAVARAVRRAVRLVRGSRCLPQALAGFVLLARRDRPSRVRIGVRREIGEPFGAHAWLETAAGIPIGGEEAGDFRVLLDVNTAEVAEPPSRSSYL
jgi:hypothetical protein